MDRNGPPLRIALVAPPWFEVPPNGYGGIEALCFSLSEGLTARGHAVTLFGAGRTRTSANFVRTYARAPSERLGEAMPEVLHAMRVGRALAELGPFDVIHDHSFAGPLLAWNRRTPTVVTAHGPIEGELGLYYAALPATTSLVAISDAQRHRDLRLTWAATVYNGLPVDEYPFRSTKEDFALFMGRMCPEKAPHLAIEACREAGVDLVMAAKCNEPREREYFEAEIRPRLGPGVEFVGQVGGSAKTDLLARARCLLFPIRWEEPFGMVMVEAMACGTPVVALEGGSVREVVAHGVSGYVCGRPEELAEAVRRVDAISPKACRDRARRFDVSRMVAGYEALYERLAAHGAAAASGATAR